MNNTNKKALAEASAFLSLVSEKELGKKE